MYIDIYIYLYISATRPCSIHSTNGGRSCRTNNPTTPRAHTHRANLACAGIMCMHAHIHVLTTCACAWAHRWTSFQHNSTTHNATPQDLLDATNFAIQTPEVKVKVWGKDGKAELLDGMSFAKRCRCSKP